jgi:hypothetical protein
MIFENGIYEFATSWRIDNPRKQGWKQFVCGVCVREQDANDPTKSAGHHLCEQCGKPVGRSVAYERADELLARICPVAARQRKARLEQ